MKGLMESGERIAMLDLDHPLPQFEGQLDGIVFSGLLGFPDMKSAHEGAKENFVSMFKMMRMMMKGPVDPTDELWVHHVPSGTVIAGENLGWMFTPEDHARLPGMFKKMMKASEVYVPTQARKVDDAGRVHDCWERILGWPAKALITYHDTPGLAWTDDPVQHLSSAVSDAQQL
jgi:hypothetical protein